MPHTIHRSPSFFNPAPPSPPATLLHGLVSMVGDSSMVASGGFASPFDLQVAMAGSSTMTANGEAPVAPITPDAVSSATLKVWYRSDNLALSSAFKTTGASPPAIALGGNLVASDQIHIVPDGSGGPGTGTVQVVLNGNTVLTHQSTVAASGVAIPGSTATLTFPSSGNYSAGVQTWDSLASGWRDKTSNGFQLLQGTASKEPLVITTGGTAGNLPVLRTDGTAVLMSRNDTSGDFANSVFGGTDKPFEVWCLCNVTTISAGHIVWAASHTTDANLPIVSMSVQATTGLNVRRRATSGNDKILHAAIPIKPGIHLFRWVFDGTTSTVYDNGVPVIGPGSGVSGTHTLGVSITLNVFEIAAQIQQNGTNSFLAADYSELFAFNPPVSAGDAAGLLSYIK